MLPASVRAQVERLEEQAWPGGSPGHDPALDPVALVLLDGPVVASALSILSKEIEHAGERYAASGVSSVVTDTRARGRGYGHRLLSAARSLIADSGADLAIFSCDRPLWSFYESAGFVGLVDSVLIGGTREFPFPSDQFDKVVLAAFFSARAVANAAGFSGARIELYPGERDKLW